MRGRAPATTAAGARPCYHPLPCRTKRERGARPAAPLRRDCCIGNRRQSFGKVHRRLPEALVRAMGASASADEPVADVDEAAEDQEMDTDDVEGAARAARWPHSPRRASRPRCVQLASPRRRVHLPTCSSSAPVDGGRRRPAAPDRPTAVVSGARQARPRKAPCPRTRSIAAFLKLLAPHLSSVARVFRESCFS